jgi:hypothetical protein
MNAPEHETMEELAEIALDKQRWKRGANAIKHGSIGEYRIQYSSSSTKPNIKYSKQ